MVLYKKLISELYLENKDLLARFDQVHQKFATDQKSYQKAFNETGEKVMIAMRKVEKTLCGKSERSGMGVYSSNLADKYWQEIKKRYPLIDFIGARIE